MTTPEDLRANAEYVRMADQFVEVPGGSNNNNFATVTLIVETAEAVVCRRARARARAVRFARLPRRRVSPRCATVSPPL